MEKYYLKNYLESNEDSCAYLRSATNVPLHTHTDFYEFIIVTYGSYENAGKVCEKNTLLIYQPGTSHSMQVLEPNSNHLTLLISIGFMNDNMSKYFPPNKRPFDFSPIFYQLTNSQMNFITELINSIIGIPSNERNDTYRLILHNIFYIISHAKYSSFDTNLNSSYAEVLLDRLNNFHYMNKEISELYTDFPVSQSTLCSEFKKLAGTTIVQYRNMKRMEYAAQLLTNWNSNVTEVAAQLNISCVSYFSKEFKKLYGVSPKQYQILHRKPYPMLENA